LASSKRLLVFLAVGIAVAFLVVRRLRTPSSPVHEAPPPPPAVEPRKALQADAEGQYVPGYRFSVGRFRFTGFSLRPEAVVTFATSGSEHPVFCQEATISAATIHLRCDDPEVGVVTIKGKFLTRLATTQLDTPAVVAVVTVRAGSGEILYSAQDSFVWEPGR
jgi:hypothetical protein